MERLQLSKQLFEMAKVGNCSGARDLIASGADLFYNQGFIFYGVNGNALLRATYENDVDCVREITEGLNEVGKIGQINDIEREYGMSPFCYVRKSQGVIQNSHHVLGSSLTGNAALACRRRSNPPRPRR